VKFFLQVGIIVVCLALNVLDMAHAFKPAPPTRRVRIVINEFLPGEHIRGEVKDLSASECTRYKILMYVRTDKWYIHPYASGGAGRSFASVDSSCAWSIQTVIRYPIPIEVAFLLVEIEYRPTSQVFHLEQLDYLSIYVREWKEPYESKRQVYAQTIQGEIGSSARWGTGWLDLVKKRDFHKGDRLRLTVGGSANKIVVRLLSRGSDPNTPSGIDGGIVRVPENRVVEITLQEDHKNVTQISVHGSANPWGRFPLGGGNGPATLLSAEYIVP